MSWIFLIIRNTENCEKKNAFVFLDFKFYSNLMIYGDQLLLWCINYCYVYSPYAIANCINVGASHFKCHMTTTDFVLQLESDSGNQK